MAYNPEKYKKLWETCTIRPEKLSAAKNVVAKIEKNKREYEEIQNLTGVPWDIIGCIHYMESSCRPNTYLGNGDPLFDANGTPIKSVHVPAGRGPFKNFVEGAVDALSNGRWNTKDWSIEHVLYMCENYNGMGYANKGINSPYLWAGTNQYGQPPHVGRYIADGVFDKNAISDRTGIACILKAMRSGDVPPPIPEEVKPINTTTPANSVWNPLIFFNKMDNYLNDPTPTRFEDLKNIVWPSAKEKILTLTTVKREVN